MEIPAEVIAFVQATQHPPFLRAIKPPYDPAMVARLTAMARQFSTPEPDTPQLRQLRRAESCSYRQRIDPMGCCSAEKCTQPGNPLEGQRVQISQDCFPCRADW